MCVLSSSAFKNAEKFAASEHFYSAYVSTANNLKIWWLYNLFLAAENDPAIEIIPSDLL